MTSTSPTTVADVLDDTYKEVKRKWLAGAEFAERKHLRGDRNRFIPSPAKQQKLSTMVKKVIYDAGIIRPTIKKSLYCQLYAVMGMIPVTTKKKGQKDDGVPFADLLIHMLTSLRMDNGHTFKVDNSHTTNFPIMEVGWPIQLFRRRCNLVFVCR